MRRIGYSWAGKPYFGPGGGGGRNPNNRRTKHWKDATYRQYTKATIPRYWPPNELNATLEGSYKFRMDTAITAHANSLTAFQCFGFGGTLDCSLNSMYVTNSTAGTRTSPATLAFPVHTTLSPEYTRMAILSTKYRITFSSNQEVPNGFKIYTWQSDTRFPGIPNLTDTGQLRVTGDPDTTAFPADPAVQLAILDRHPRLLRPMVYTNLSVDSSTNRATVTWSPDYRMSRGDTAGIRGPLLHASTSANHPSGHALCNATIANSLITNFGTVPWLSVMICRRNLGGDATPDRTMFITHLEVHVTHRVQYYQRIAG